MSLLINKVELYSETCYSERSIINPCIIWTLILSPKSFSIILMNLEYQDTFDQTL